MSTTQRILITGMSGGIANLLASTLSPDIEIIGIDTRPYRQRWCYRGEFIQAPFTCRIFSDLFHHYSFNQVLLLGHLASLPSQSEFDYNFNLLGYLADLPKFSIPGEQNYNFNLIVTSHLLDLCQKFSVQTVVILSTFHVYGANPENPINITEDFPLQATQTSSQALGSLGFDHLATVYLWKNQKCRTILLRPCNIVGPHIHNTISKILRCRFIPHLMGFDPMHQFIHELDVVHALQLILQNPALQGIYNLVGGGAIPTNEVIRLREAKTVPVPHILAGSAMNIASQLGVGFPKYLLDYFRYPVIISDRKFRTESGFQHCINAIDTLKNV